MCQPIHMDIKMQIDKSFFPLIFDMQDGIVPEKYVPTLDAPKAAIVIKVASNTCLFENPYRFSLLLVCLFLVHM